LKMARIKTDDSSGWVEVRREAEDSSADVYVTAYDCGASLKLAEVRELIEELVKVAGFKSEPTGNGMGLIIQFPESEAVTARRDELAYKFFAINYARLDYGRKHSIEFIIDGEKARGELK
jgi:hypothetical protein